MDTPNVFETTLARIRGLLADAVRTEDPGCCLFLIEELVDGVLGDTPGIPPEEEPV